MFLSFVAKFPFLLVCHSTLILSEIILIVKKKDPENGKYTFFLNLSNLKIAVGR